MTANLTDFNDLHATQGLDAVRQQLLKAESSPALTVVPKEPIPSPAHPLSVQSNDDSNASFANFTLDQMVDNFSLLYGTDLAWDKHEHIQMKLPALRHIVGRDLFKAWNEHPARKIARGLVFEPDGNTPANHINLFRGFPLTPSRVGRDGCMKIIDHVFNLSGCREPEFRHLLKWMAFPLQNQGAKMDSSVIMYGAEGPGKSVLWEQVISKIYGKYAVTIGQAQLESQFTAWQSCKVFAVCEEVVSRSERAQHKGQLKHLVTGSKIQVNEKGLPLREEQNHLNFVFLSNSTIPLELDMGDRRYLVLYCGHVPSGDYFKELFEEINNGGIESFYRYLLDIDLTGFDEHTRPPVNQDKTNLITASLPSPILFLQEWSEGHLDLPYCSCAKSDLFIEFSRWCDRANEFKKRDRDFVAEIRRYLMEGRHDLRINGYDRKTVRVWVTPEDAAHQFADDYLTRIESSCSRFRTAVKERQNPAGDN